MVSSFNYFRRTVFFHLNKKMFYNKFVTNSSWFVLQFSSSLCYLWSLKKTAPSTSLILKFFRGKCTVDFSFSGAYWLFSLYVVLHSFKNSPLPRENEGIFLISKNLQRGCLERCGTILREVINSPNDVLYKWALIYCENDAAINDKW